MSARQTSSCVASAFFLPIAMLRDLEEAFRTTESDQLMT
jgi:hypothetical protein